MFIEAVFNTVGQIETENPKLKEKKKMKRKCD
jgi:hypothetical protein